MYFLFCRSFSLSFITLGVVMLNIFQQQTDKYSLEKAMVELVKNTQKSVQSLPLFISLNNTPSYLETSARAISFDSELSASLDDIGTTASSVPTVLKPFLQHAWHDLKRKYLCLKAYRMLNKSPEMNPDFIIAQLILHQACRYLDRKCASLINGNKMLNSKKITSLKDELVQSIFDGMLEEKTDSTGGKIYLLKKTATSGKPLKVSWMTGATSMFFSSLKCDNELSLAPEISRLPISAKDKEELLQIQQVKLEQMRNELTGEFIYEFRHLLSDNLLSLFKDNFYQLYQLIDKKVTGMYLPEPNTRDEDTQL